MEIERSVTVGQPVDRVFAYLSDFTNTTEWDPGTVRTERVAGDGRRRHALPQRVEVPRP